MTEKQSEAWFSQGDQSFKDRAPCRGMDPEFFFPGLGESGKEAKAVCNGTKPTKDHHGTAPCPVKKECLEYALLNNEKFGIWGGLSERERRIVKRQIANGTNTTIVLPPRRRPIQHGTPQGYETHRRRRETPCDACKEAHARRNRGWRNRANDPVTVPTLKTLVHLVHAENARASRTPDRS